MTRNTHDRQLDHHANDLTSNIELDGSTTSYADGDDLQDVISDLDDRIIAGGGSGTFSGARIYRTTAQTIAQFAQDAIACNAERYDTDSYHSTVTNNSRLTLPTTATYHFGTSIEFEVLSGAGAYDLVVSLFYDGTTEIATARLPGVATLAGRTPAITVSTDWPCTATHYVEVKVFHTATTGQVDSGASPRSAELWVHRLG